jgi:hypothetical protein
VYQQPFVVERANGPRCFLLQVLTVREVGHLIAFFQYFKILLHARMPEVEIRERLTSELYHGNKYSCRATLILGAAAVPRPVFG